MISTVIFSSDCLLILMIFVCFIFSSIESFIKIFSSPWIEERASFSPTCELTQKMATLKVPFFLLIFTISCSLTLLDLSSNLKAKTSVVNKLFMPESSTKLSSQIKIDLLIFRSSLKQCWSQNFIYLTKKTKICCTIAF